MIPTNCELLRLITLIMCGASFGSLIDLAVVMALRVILVIWIVVTSEKLVLRLKVSWISVLGCSCIGDRNPLLGVETSTVKSNMKSNKNSSTNGKGASVPKARTAPPTTRLSRATRRRLKRAEITSNSAYENSLSHPSLSECTAEYAATIADPFASGPEGACIPDVPALMTRRIKVWNRGTFSTSGVAGAAGTGFIIMSPYHGIANDTNRFILIDNPATYATTTFDVAALANMIGRNSNSDYVSTDVGSGLNDIQYRVVSAGLRIRNVTSVLNKGGSFVGLMEPTHQTLNTRGYSDFQAYLESKDFSSVATPDWVQTVYRPVRSDDLDFHSAMPPTGVGYGPDSDFMGFYVQSPDTSGANSQTYEYQAFANYEIQGATAIGKQPSHADPNGYAAVNAMMNFSPVLKAPYSQDPVRVSHAAVQATGHYVDHHLSVPGGNHPKKVSEPFDWGKFLSGALPIVGSVVSAFL